MRWGRAAAVLAIAAVVAGAAAVVAVVGTNGPSAPTAAASAPGVADRTATPAPTPTPTATPLTEVEQLLADSGDPNACAASFSGEGIALAPLLESQGTLYQNLPIPDRPGFVFAGWYATPADASALNVAQRVNGADAVSCIDQQVMLYAAWTSPDEVAAANVGVPILMYHQFTANPHGEDGWLRGNYAYIGDFEAHMKYLADSQVYLPTWDELSAFVDGRLFIPKRCAIVTDDDADVTWTTMAAPIVDRYKILTTSFTITTAYPGPPPNMYVIQRSHTHDMHTAGDDGNGRMVNWSVEQIVADMNASAAVLGGTRQVMAYPYGHYNDVAKEGLRQAGFEMARTIEPGYVRAGTDKLALPAQRINYGMGLDAFVAIVG